MRLMQARDTLCPGKRSPMLHRLGIMICFKIEQSPQSSHWAFGSHKRKQQTSSQNREIRAEQGKDGSQDQLLSSSIPFVFQSFQVPFTSTAVVFKDYDNDPEANPHRRKLFVFWNPPTKDLKDLATPARPFAFWTCSWESCHRLSWRKHRQFS